MKKENELYNQKFYETNQKDLNASLKIMTYIYNKLKPKSVVDFGCGSGTWLSSVEKLGCKDIIGLDGDYVNKEWLLFDSKKFIAIDLREKVDLSRKFDLAISLEVAEHISEEFSEIYLQNLTNASDIILFSAAIPYQDGTNHVNEQYPSYWIKKFEKYDYVPYDALRWKFWNDESIAFWYRQNIMFFCKKNRLNELKKMFPIGDMPTDLVHPVRLENLYFDDLHKLKQIEEKYEDANKTINELTSQNLIANQKIKDDENYINELEKNVKPKVSIVVPVFNVKNFLRECLDSILGQTLEDIEVLCGDGGSNDGSLEILREYEKSDKRVKVISREGSGYGQSVNECMDIARGEYIGLVESDDKVDKNMYETLYNIAKDNNLDWVKSDIYHYYSGMPENEQLVRESITYGADFYNQILNPQIDIRPYRTALHTWAGIYKKEFLNKHHIRHHETPGGSYQDVGFHLKTLYYAERVCFIESPFYCWRQDNPGSSIHYNASKLIEKSFKEWELNKQFLESSLDTNERMWGSFNYRRYYSYKWTIELANDLEEEATEYARKELLEAYENGKVIKDFFSKDEWKEFLEFLKVN